MDPVSQVLAQQHSGSAGGAGFGQFFAQGVQARQNQQRLNLSSRQLQVQEAQEQRLQRRDDMLLPLEQQMMQSQIANLGINGVVNFLKAQSEVQVNAALPELYRLQMAFAESPEGYSDPALMEEARTLANRFPKAFAPGAPGAELLTFIKAAPMLNSQFKQVLDMNQQLKGSGMVVQGVNQKGEIDFTQEPRAANQPADIQVASEITRLETLLQQTQDPAEREQISRQLRNLQMQTAPRGGFDITLPDGTRIAQGGGASGNQPASITTKAEQVVNSAASLMEFGHEIIETASQGNVGLSGNLKRLWAEFGGQAGTVEAGPEFEFAQATTFFKAQAQQVLKSDHQMAEDERKMIISDLPSKGLKESDETAKKKARAAMRKVAESARRQAIRAGVPLPPQLMTYDEILDFGKQNNLSEDEVIGLVRKSPFVQ